MSGASPNSRIRARFTLIWNCDLRVRYFIEGGILAASNIERPQPLRVGGGTRSVCIGIVIIPIAIVVTLLLAPSIDAFLGSKTVFFVNMRGGQQVEIGRYVGGQPNPIGPVAMADGCHLWSPSVTLAHGKFWLYAAEHDCWEWRRIVLFTSRDGVHFERHGTVIEEAGLRMPYVVYDDGIFRAWYTVDSGGIQGKHLVYAESRDGLTFRRDGIKAVVGDSFDAGAMTVSTVFRDGSEWYLLYAGFNRDMSEAAPGIMTFRDPRQSSYRKLGRLIAERGEDTPKLDPSYVCRAKDGIWHGVFTVFGGTTPQLSTGALRDREWTVAYYAESLLGPWALDRGTPSPFLPLFNGEAKISVENPTPVTSATGVPAC